MDGLELSIEQEFNHRIFADYVQQISHEQAQDLLVQIHKQMIQKDNIYKQLILSQEKAIIDSLFGARN